MKVSVALVTYNSEKYLREQVDTILLNLGDGDEVVVSDDGSSDSTLSILQEYAEKDRRIAIYRIAHSGCNGNYENAISHCTGDIIFLSDDDNVWMEGKVKKVLQAFAEHPRVWFVQHDCVVGDSALHTISPSFFKDRKAKPGLFRNIMKTSYGGSLIAFKKELISRILPFPKKMPFFYDEWIGLEATKHGKVLFLNETLSIWRRHEGSASTGYIAADGKVVAKKKNGAKGSFRRLWERLSTRSVKIWWALIK